ncbi:MAG: hypothetical protein U0936_24450 [Planctomycetaceae bacterium]
MVDHPDGSKSAGAVVFGIVMAASSYAIKPLYDPEVSSRCLMIGLALILVPAIFKLMMSGFHWRSVAIFLSLVGAIELLNLMNLEDPLEFRMMMHRYICYALCAAGIVYGYESQDDYQPFPGIAHVLTAGFTCLIGGIWLRSAGGAAGVRFVGDSEMLTPVGVGYTFGIMGCVSAAFLFTEKRLIFRVMHLVAYCVCVLAILSTGSRGSAVFSLVIIAAGVIIRLRSFEDGLRYSLLFVTVIMILVAVVMTNDYARDQMDFMLVRFEFISRGAVDISIVERHERRLFYYRSINEWIMTGLKGYDFDYPHNIFYECVLRYGIIGCGLISAILYSAVRAGRNLRASVSSPFLWVVSSVGFFTLLVVQVNLMLEHARCLWLFVGYWGVKEVQRLRVGQVEHFFPHADDEHDGMTASFGDLSGVQSLEKA